MSKNKALIAVSPDQVLEGVSVIHVGSLLDALYGKDAWYGLDYTETSKVVRAWVARNGAHYYSDEKWVLDENGNDTRGFSVWTGVYQAKRFGARIVVCENLS
jgi:hypothetical protein